MKINTTNKLPLLIVAGLNLSVISSMLIAIALREYWGICNLVYWKQLSNISDYILLMAIILANSFNYILWHI